MPVARSWRPGAARVARASQSEKLLPAARRLTAAAEFRSVVRRGKRAGGPLLTLHLGQLTDQSSGQYVDKSAERPLGPRVGFVVGKSVGGAVVRNRVKRQLRHLMRDRLTVLSPDDALVVRAQPSAAGTSSRELGAELDRCLQRVVS